MKTLITGIAGTGKSTIIRALNEQGIFAIDLHNIPGLFFWQNKITKEPIAYSPVYSQEWFETVDRICNIELLQKLLQEHPTIIAAGTTSGSNQKEFLALFDKIILLQSNPETLTHRLQTRTNISGYGKTTAEQEDNIAWQKEFDPLMISYGAIPVTTEKSLEETVQQIITLTH
jgi:shikimate kinase